MKKLLAFLLIFSLGVVFLFSSALAEEWVCPKCGRNNSGNFCPDCGTKFEPWVCPDCGTSNLSAFCENCGAARPVEAMPLAGAWKFNLYFEDMVLVFREDLSSCLLVAPKNLTLCSCSVKGDTLSIDIDEMFNYLLGDWHLIDGKLVNETLQVTAQKTEDPVCFSVVMSGGSMNDTIVDNDELTIECRDPADMKRFDIVVSYIPGREGTLFVKRLVGLPGDTVELRDGYLYVNGEMYVEPHVSVDYRGSSRNTFGPYVVPEDEYFLMGDHRNNSNDSRSSGTIPSRLMFGVVTMINGQPYDPFD